MLITPLVAGLGGLIAFFTVVSIVVWLPIHTFDPPRLGGLGAALRPGAVKGAEPLRLERLLRLPLRLLAAAGRPRARSTSSTRRSPSRATSTGATSRRTCSAPSGRGPTSRRSPAGIRTTGSARTSTTRASWTRCSLMPDDEVALLGQPGRAARRRTSRPAAASPVSFATPDSSTPSTSCSPTRAFPSRTPASRERTSRSSRRRTDQELESPPKDQLEEAPNLSQIDRSYWLSGNPLPVTEENLLRGKEIFLQRCVGCHGVNGNGKGPAASFLSPPPADSTMQTTHAAAETPAPATSTTGSCAAGRGRRWRTSATGSQCRRHLAGRPLPEDDPERDARRRIVVPEPKDYIVWQPSEELLAWVKNQHPRRTTRPSPTCRSTDPYMQEAMRIFPGLAPGDKLFVNDGRDAALRWRTPPPGSSRSTRICSTAPGPRRRRAAASCRRRRRRQSRRPFRASNETRPRHPHARRSRRARGARGGLGTRRSRRPTSRAG